MKNRIKRFIYFSEEEKLLFIAGLMSFSIGVWQNYRQLWLENIGFTIDKIGSLLSISLICSGIISFITSFFSTRIKIKNIVLESILLRTISMMLLLLINNIYIIKINVIIIIVCDIIYSISFYPLYSNINSSNAAFNKKNLIEYITRDTGIILFGFLIGKYIGNYLINYNSCIFISFITSLLSFIFLLFHKSNKKKIKYESYIYTLKKIFKYKSNYVFFIEQLFVNISYGVVFDLVILMLTNYIGLNISITSLLIIVSNMIGSVMCFYLSKRSEKISVELSSLIKFGTRALMYYIAYISNKKIIYILAIIMAYITSRLLEDNTLNVFINKIDNNSKLLFENIRYCVCSIGEGIGTYLAGLLILKSLKLVFLYGMIFTIIQIVLLIYTNSLKKKDK